MNEGKTYELIIPEWRAIVPPEWKLQWRVASGEWQAAALLVELHAGDQLRSGGGPEAEYLQAMLEHGYVKEIVASG